MATGLSVEGLVKSYGQRRALDDVTFHVEPGSMFGFVGPNGAGKTTTMRIIMGVARPDAGTVSYNGVVLDATRRRRFGYMPEERGLYAKMKVLEQLVYFGRLYGKSQSAATSAATTLLETLNLSERAGDEVERLSLGNQQRVQLAVALVHDPDVLILDEPFSGMDPVGVDALSEVLSARCDKGVPVVFSSHQLELVESLCDTVGIISKGRIVVTGPVKDVRRKHGDRTFHVEVDEAADCWWSSVPQCALVRRNGAGVVLALPHEADSDQLLDAARKAGRVSQFSEHVPKLSELFREAIAE